MRVYDINDKHGQLFAFEIDNGSIERSDVAALVQSIPAAQVVGLHPSWRDPEAFCEFIVGGEGFVVAEPYGDSSRYWIGPRDAGVATQLEAVRTVFAQHRQVPSILRLAVVVSLFCLVLAEGGRYREWPPWFTGFVAVSAFFVLVAGLVASVVRHRRIQRLVEADAKNAGAG